jgi:RHS repeat-associated protein
MFRLINRAWFRAVCTLVSVAVGLLGIPALELITPQVATAAGNPVISSLSTYAAPPGSPVTITGTGFGATQGTSKVTFAGYKATITSWSDTTIACSVPAGAISGYVGVWVGGVASNGAYFVPATPPAITQVAPLAGATDTTVAITGSNFGTSKGSGSVSFAGVTAATVSWSDTSIIASVPAGAAAGYVGVWQNGLCSNGVFFTSGTTPVLNPLGSSSAPVGTTMTVAGSNFGATQGTGHVTLGGSPVTVTAWSDTSVSFTVPAGVSAGYLGVWQNGICSNGQWFIPAPRLDSISNWWGSTGSTLTVTGAGFGSSQGTGAVKFAGTDGVVSSWSDTAITVAVPAGAAAGYIGVWQNAACSNGIYFLPMSAPAITDIDPMYAPVGGVITITGSNFGASQGRGDQVTVSGLAAPVTSWSDTTITVQVPNGATSGYVGVWKSGVASNGFPFSVTQGVQSLGVQSSSTMVSGVNAANGNLVLTGLSVSIPDKGEGTQISSTYNSQDASPGVAGVGWTFSFEQRLLGYPNGCEAWLQPDGSLHVFGRNVDGTFVPAQGTYATLVKNGDGTFTLTDKDHNVFVFGADRLLRSTTDPNGNATTLAYDGWGKPTTMTDAAGRVSTFAYDSSNRLVSITDCAGRETDFDYDAAGRLVLMTLPAVKVGPDTVNYTVSYDYDASGRLTAVTDSRGNTTNYTYDAASARVASITDPTNAVTSFAYNSAAGTSTVTDASGAKTGLTANSAGLVVQASLSGGLVTNQSYDAQGNEVAAVDSSGASTSETYDAKGRQTSTTDAADNTVTMSYTPTATASQPSTVTDSAGNKTSNSYDASGNLVSLTDPTGATTTNTYSSDGKVVQTTDPTGQTVKMSYDATGDLTGVASSSAATTSLSYDSLGDLTSVAQTGSVATMSYDQLGRNTKVTDPTGVTQSFSYDENGNKTSSVDAKGSKVQSVYDADNRVVSAVPVPVIQSQEVTGTSTSVSTGTVSYTYDSSGRTKTRTDQKGNTTTYAYDPATGQLKTETDAAGKVTTHSYDAVGNLISTLFPDGASSSFVYNKAGQVLSQNVAGRTTNYTYNAAGQRTGQTLVGGISVSQNLDAAGRVTSETVGSMSTVYGYDGAGRTTQVAPSGQSAISYGYNAAGNVSTITAGGSWSAGAYDLAGGLATITSSVGFKTLRRFDAASKVMNLTNLSSNGATLSAYTLAYDANGSIASVTDKNGAQTRYFADNLGQLINVRDATGTALYHYVYDAAGGRTASYASSAGTTTYSYDASDTTKLTTVTPQAGSPTRYAYDDQGRVISKTTSGQTTAYTWAADGYLKQANLPDGTRVAYDYDASWRMISRAYCSSGTTTTVFYHYDGDKIIAEEDGSGSVQATFGYGPDGQLFSMTRGGQTYYYQLDAHGSVVSLANASGSIVDSYGYDPFGNVTTSTVGVANPFTYSGYWQDAKTGLYHLKARWYEPVTGRFLTRDAVQDVVGDPLSVNHYLYCKNDPVNKVDPEGSYPSWAHWCWVGGQVAYALVQVAAWYYGGFWYTLARIGARVWTMIPMANKVCNALYRVRGGAADGGGFADFVYSGLAGWAEGWIPGMSTAVEALKNVQWAMIGWTNNAAWTSYGHRYAWWWLGYL